MLIMFRAKNFNSFKNDVILDLRKTRYREHLGHTFKSDEFELLKTVAIYGANASGKSNLISALSSFELFLSKQFFDSENTKDDNNLENDSESKISKVSIRPFLLSDSVDQEIEFEIIFKHKDLLFQYGYSFEDSKICSEWLLINNEQVFERKKDSLEIEFGNKYKDILKDYTKLREDRLYISILDYFATNDEIREKIDIFKEYFNTKFNIYFELIFESTIKGRVGFLSLTNEFIKNDELRKKVSEYVRRIDIGIKEFIIDKEIAISNRTGEQKEKLVPKAVHNVYDLEGSIISEKTFELEYESAGTLRFLSVIQQVLKMLDNGGVFIVDELSARLHPLVSKFIVDIFQSKLNVNNAQLIFTTHDISLMNKEQFRRDEVVLVDKNIKGESSIYTLADLGVRSDATFDKDYFKGKFGAIPIVKDVLDPKEEH
ncbi:ATP-binding protein [Clostridium sp. CS001]|uniref:AAA family ATPase n=1 Tax=Clostridium sp. CS001 TaxID=2880648 RepID=UPI001CF16F6D|nr:ATP-binding protein [Clostridium sp. CS001]MCB2289526.1 ATP-binding protein [Clostridium sp. CS001]